MIKKAGTRAARRKVSPGRPLKAEAETRRVHLLTVAAQEFIMCGFANANVARIARAAGVSNKTIYAHYPTKEALFLAMFADRAATFQRQLIAEMAANEGAPEQVLLTFGLSVAKAWTSPDGIGVYRLILTEAYRLPFLVETFDGQMELLRRPLADYLRKQIELRVLAITDLDTALHHFSLLVYGQARERALLGKPLSPEHVDALARRGVRLFIAGYAIGKA